VTGSGFGEAGGAYRRSEQALEQRLVEVVAAPLAGRLVRMYPSRGEDPLPGPFAGSARVFASEGVGQGDVAGRALEVALVLSLDAPKVLAEGRDEAGRQDGQAILAALAVADEDLAAMKVHVLDAQPAAF
jgi:hypothetical protein